MPKVSVIVTNYNKEKYIGSCLESLIKQNYQDYEVVVFDDCSSDNSIEIINSYTAKDPRFRLIKLEENRGIAYVRSISLSYCQGEYIAIMDGDDISYSERLFLQAASLDDHPGIVMVTCYNTEIDKQGRIIKYDKRTPISDIEIRWRLSTSNCIVHSSVMFRKSAALQAGNYNLVVKLAVDMYLYSRLMEFGQIGTIPEFLIGLRKHPDRINHKNKTEQLNCTYSINKLTAERLLNLSLSNETAKGLFHYKATALDSPETTLEIIHALESYYKLHMRRATLINEIRLLNLCYLRSLLVLRRRNKNQAWYPGIKDELYNQIKSLLVSVKYSWIRDKKILKSPGNLTWLTYHAILDSINRM